MSMQPDFVCENCELDLPQSPIWEEFCIPCHIAMLESDIDMLHAVQRTQHLHLLENDLSTLKGIDNAG
jgi:hypothetical protein